MFQSTLPTRGSDPKGSFFYQYFVVSIHAPHEGERPSIPLTVPLSNWFQSTLPTRGSDSMHAPLPPWALCFNPRSPRGGATQHMKTRSATCYVSIHAPHEGERPFHVDAAIRIDRRFNPRSPRGGATRTWQRRVRRGSVSIHAPHEGERRPPKSRLCARCMFQSTLPTRGSDGYGARRLRAARPFQSTLPTRGSDFAAQARHPPPYRFNPRSPRGGATFRRCLAISKY